MEQDSNRGPESQEQPEVSPQTIEETPESMDL